LIASYIAWQAVHIQQNSISRHGLGHETVGPQATDCGKAFFVNPPQHAAQVYAHQGPGSSVAFLFNFTANAMRGQSPTGSRRLSCPLTGFCQSDILGDG
jgi:hypothetical protein